MLEKEQLQKYLQKCLTTGADFAEIYQEESFYRTIKLIDQKIQKVSTSQINGVGIRICLKDKIVYGSTSKLDNIESLIERLIGNFNEETKNIQISLPEKTIYQDKIKVPHHDYPIEKKKLFLHQIDELSRKESTKVNQVQAILIEQNQRVIISNSNNKYTEDNRTLTRFSATVFAKDGDNIEKAYVAPGFKKGYEFIEEINLQQMIKEVVKSAVEKLTAIDCPSGELPVIIGNGFGGVIFHEACVHALEATTVAKGSSVFNDLLEEPIASPKVTIVDDGTLECEWGSTNIDDEGESSKRNILIENGILKNYLIDYINSKVMNMPTTSSGRRQSYCYAPTSRMTNTYLLPGNDSINEMISSIPYGLYAKNMGGGSVDPKTGDFNFSVNEAYLIEDGKITIPVKGASLIGNGAEIIKRVSMVSDDLSLSAGLCGSTSGSIPVTVGQPTIKVDKILVGGKGEKVHE